MTTTIARGALSMRAVRSAPALLAALMLTNAALSGAVDDMPLRSVTLYRSGVAYFERSGTIDPGAGVSLELDLAHLNDVLRSIVVLDNGAKTPPSISYTSSEPLERLLDRYQVDVRRVNTTMELLGQLRGVRVRFSTTDGPVEGLVMGVEARNLRTDEDSGQFVTLLTDLGVKSINLSRVSTFDVLDERVANDLRDALRTLAQRRAEDRAELSVRFGDGPDRAATIGYMHESPVWKTSYRLVLPEETGAKPLLQGWAIVENQTDEDWDDVRLSLVSGRPVAFTMNLREPLFIDRPEIAPPIPGAMVSRAYDDAVKMQRASALAAPTTARISRDGSAYLSQTFNSRAAPQPRFEEAAQPETRVALGGTIAGQNAANATTSGEQFRYEIAHVVDLPAKSNAMLPIVSSPIEGRRVSIYNAADLAEHPMRGVEFTNTSGADLAAGPITVYDGDSYAGDAQVGFTSRGQDRLLSYAVDQDVRALRDEGQTHRVTRLRIVDGVIERSSVSAKTTTYTFINRDAVRAREIIVEHPKMGADWRLTSPEKASSESETLQRFRVDLDPGETTALPVSFEMTLRTTIALTEMNLPELIAYSTNGVASKAVVDAVREAQRLRTETKRYEMGVENLERERDGIGKEQARIRSNMNTIDRNSDLYARYMRTLAAQEDRLVAIQDDLQATRAELSKAEAAFTAYLRNLSVE
jgi:hypothetical protein